jgi:polyisoprenoid-binding protein YceI
MNTQKQSKWIIDPNHSQIQFKVKHLAVSNVTGIFKTFKGTVTSPSDDFQNAEIDVEIDVNNLSTNQADRDQHLQSDLFFDAEKFPVIRFNGMLQKMKEEYVLEGDLTIRDISKTIKLEVHHTGIGQGRFGDTRAGFEINGKINRKDFGLTSSLLTETGNLIVGEEVKLHFDIQLIQEAK